MTVLEQTLRRLGVSFTVRDIMVPKERLVCASAEADAPRISEQYPDYNVIPIRDRELLVAFYDRDAKSTRSITFQDLVAGDTSVTDLVEILSTREFCFVLVGNRIGGYVHFSDLNNPIVKLAFYVVLEAFERHLLALISPVSEKELLRILGLSALNRIQEKMRKARANDANLGLESFLCLHQILTLAADKGKLALGGNQRERINRFRNSVAHAGKLLVENHGDVRTLAEAKRNCIGVLNGVRTAPPA
jgi:hypothetical protein